MDVIASGLAACPWGLNGYGFDPYIATSPGNSVLALARFWLDNTTETMAAEEQLADRSLRVRYEDLVTDPETVAAGIFRFLGVAAAPGITAECFSAERERFGPADHKIWYTSKVSGDSVGRGWSVPTTMIAPPVLAGINELAAKLGYLAVDGDWGTMAPPSDLRVAPAIAHAAKAGVPAAAGPGMTKGRAARPVAALPGPVRSRLLGSRLQSGLAAAPRSATQWEPHATEELVAIWIPDDPGEAAEHWLVDLKERTAVFASGAAQENSAWDIIGSAQAWEQVITGRLNLSVALRSCRLRAIPNADASCRCNESGFRVPVPAFPC